LAILLPCYQDEAAIAETVAAFVLAAVAALVFACPLLVTFLETGLVPRPPTAVLATGIASLGFLRLGSGIVLDRVARGRHETKRLETPTPDFG
jgi:hypothetical protein